MTFDLNILYLINLETLSPGQVVLRDLYLRDYLLRIPGPATTITVSFRAKLTVSTLQTFLN